MTAERMPAEAVPAKVMSAKACGEPVAAEARMGEVMVMAPAHAMMSITPVTAAMMGPPRVMMAAMVRGMTVVVMTAMRGVTPPVVMVPSMMMPRFATVRIPSAIGDLPFATVAR